MGWLEERALRKIQEQDAACGHPTQDTLKSRINAALFLRRWSIVLDSVDKGAGVHEFYHIGNHIACLLVHAVCKNKPDVVKALLDKGAYQFDDALTHAQEKGYADIAKLLIEKRDKVRFAVHDDDAPPSTTTQQIEMLAEKFPDEFAAVAAKVLERNAALRAETVTPVKILARPIRLNGTTGV